MNILSEHQMKTKGQPSATCGQVGVLQRACACGQHTSGAGGECEECKKKREGMLQRAAIQNSLFLPKPPDRPIQTKLAINKLGDEYEQEADRIASEVVHLPSLQFVRGQSPRIQRLTMQPSGDAEITPASVDQALASPGSPLEPKLRHDMEQRLGYDFSHVRVHANGIAMKSAQDVNAYAYTVGHDIIFAADQYTPGTPKGRQLIAHELTHVVQQSNTGIVQRQPKPEADTGPCPHGETRLGSGQPCTPITLPGRQCPMGQVYFAGSCVPWRPSPLGGTLQQPPTMTLPSQPSSQPSSTSTSGKSQRIANIDTLRGCAYTVTYANARNVDCNTAFRSENGKDPSVPLCGVAMVYDITSVSASGPKCPATLEGLKLTEIVKSDRNCEPPNYKRREPPPCAIGPGGNLTGCTDILSLCGPTSDFHGPTCTEFVDQEIEVGGQLAEEHEIIFKLNKNGNNCIGTVTRN